MMDETFRRMGDPDGNFIDDFQGPGFHSRVFELACFAYFEETGWSIDRTHTSPDFLIEKGGVRIAVEAVTLNPTAGRQEDIAVSTTSERTIDEVVARCNDELPIRLASAISNKLRKKYWEKPHCRGLPFVLIAGPFHEGGSTAYVDESIARYLFGRQRFHDWVDYNGVLVRELPVASHSFGGRSVPSNFFAAPAATPLSAVIWTNQFTISRFARLHAEAEGLPEPAEGAIVRGWYANPDGCGAKQFEYGLGSGAAPPESWARGVSVMSNSMAAIALPEGRFESSATFRLRDAALVCDIHHFHTLTCFTRFYGPPDV